MKSLAKFGLAGLVGGAALVLSAAVGATNAQAHADLTAIQNDQTRAKVENDRIKLNCINDKLVLAKAMLNIIDAGDQTKLDQLHALRVAADGCAGKKQVADSSNSFTSPAGASEPGDGGAIDWGTVFEPPINASPSTPTSPRTRIHHR